MENNQMNSPFVNEGVTNKDRHFEAQMKRVFRAFFSHPKTMLMVEFETGVMRSNICRYVAEWKKQDCIRIVRKSSCTISKHRAGFYTTNPALFPAIVEPSNTVKP